MVSQEVPDILNEYARRFLCFDIITLCVSKMEQLY
jgi:hypothetical protein